MAHTDIQEMWKEGNNAGELDSPPFECEQVTIILKTIFDRIMGLLRKSLGSGSNMVLQGSKGVGKTSILKAVRYYLNSKHSNELDCTYFDLSGPEFSLVALDILLKEKANDDKLHVLLIDEIQLLYTCKDKDSARELSAKIANMAKKNNFLFIVTGSCSRLTEYLFHHDQPTEEQKGYADFNCTVFDEQRLFPLRNKEDVTNAYNLWKSDYNDEIDIADVFSITGGIGRLIQAHATTAHLNCPSVVDYLSDELSVCPIIFNLFDLNRNVKSCWEQIAISKVDALELIIKSKGCDHAEASKQLAYFVDKNILYLRDNYCEILRFRWISELQELKENHDFLVNYALYSCLVGWKKEGSPGSFVELYLLQKLHENSMLANVATVNAKIKLALGSSIVENTLYRMKYDFGLDGIWFWKEDRKWRVSGVQLKLGMLHKNIIQGGDMDCKKQNDGTIRGIFSKAVKGFSKAQEILDKFLARHEPFILDEFYLVTSKTVKPEYYDNYSALWTQSETVMTKLYNSKKETDPDTKFPKIVSHNLENFQFKVIDQAQFLQILPTNVRSFLNLQ